MNVTLNRTNKSNGAIPVSIQKFEPIDETTARCLISYVGDRSERGLDLAIATTWMDDEGASSIALAKGSAQVVGKEYNGATLVDVILKKNEIKRPYVEEETAGMTAVSANVFSDENDMIWSVVGEGDQRMLVQASPEDMSEVLSSRRTLSIATAATGYDLGEEYAAGDFVLCYDAERERAFFGFGVAEGHVYDYEEETLLEVSSLEVAAVDEGALLTDKLEFAALDLAETMDSETMLNEYLAYMRKLYKNHTAYIRQIEESLKAAFNRKSFA